MRTSRYSDFAPPVDDVSIHATLRAESDPSASGIVTAPDFTDSNTAGEACWTRSASVT